MSVKEMNMYSETEKKLILSMIQKYLFDYGEEVHIEALIKFIMGDENLSIRHKVGHLTASCWIVNQSFEKALFTHHKKLDMWLQLGGHVEMGEGLVAGAKREAYEESGLSDIRMLNENIYDIDIHLIPENSKYDAHYHYDIRFLFQADSNELLKISEESNDLKWIVINQIENYNKDESILRMVRKMENLHG